MSKIKVGDCYYDETWKCYYQVVLKKKNMVLIKRSQPHTIGCTAATDDCIFNETKCIEKKHYFCHTGEALWAYTMKKVPYVRGILHVGDLESNLKEIRK